MSARLDGLIKPYDPAKIEQSSYTLGIGREYFVTPHGNHADPEGCTKLRLAKGQGFTIPSGQFAFVLTNEFVEIPNDAIGFISVRTPLKFQGLVNISGFHVNPGFKGRLIVSVFNAGPSNISLAQGEGLLKLWYANLDKPTADVERDVIQNEYISSSLVNQVPGQLHSLQSMSREIEKLKFDLRATKWVAGIVVAILAVVASFGGK